MTYGEAREFISQSNQYGSVLGLEAITELLHRLNDPQNRLKIIHVAGTNGKGSTGAFLTAILNAAGYRVGRYISPAVFSYRERIQISYLTETGSDLPAASGIPKCREPFAGQVTEYISREGVCGAIEQIQPVCESMVREGHSHPTSFEIETAMMFLYLLRERVDFVVLEVGLGGRLDATNVIRQPVLSVITSVSMDHMQYLGDTLEKIAAEKAGIIKPGCPVVTCEQEPDVSKVLQEKAALSGAVLYTADSGRAGDIIHTLQGTEFTYGWNGQTVRYKIRLLGKYQIKNAVLALETARVIDQAGYPVGEDALCTGLSLARWSGRFEQISADPGLFIDGAHNEEAAKTLRESIGIYFADKRIIFMIGVLADKDYKSILDITAPLADTIITLTPDNPRALSSEHLAKEARAYCDRVIDAKDAARALSLACDEAGEEDVIIAFGSLSFLGDLVRIVKSQKDESKGY